MTDGTALDRVLRQVGGGAILDRLARMAGADLTTLLLRVMRERTDRLTPADVFRRYLDDRFVAPSAVPFERLRATEDTLISLLPGRFQLLTLAPVTPLGTHSVVGTVHQDRVVATVRRTEVAADATNGLALAAAELRHRALAMDARATDEIRLAAVQRVVRAQRFDGQGRFSHFGLLGMVTAGRDTGDLAFERRHVAEHASHLMTTMSAFADRAELRLTVTEPRLAPVADAVRAALAGLPGVDVVDDPDRVAGRGYYAGLCFKAYVVRGSVRTEIADGGLVDWTRRLLGSGKERLVISGIGIEGLASL